MEPTFVSSNPSEPTDRRAVCGKIARTVRREGGLKPISPSYPYRHAREIAVIQVAQMKVVEHLEQLDLTHEK